MESLTVISACYGSYDLIKPPVPQTGYEPRWLLVTDEENIEAPGWEVLVERRPHVHPNVAAKLPKLRPDLYTDDPVSIWIDASALLQPGFVASAMEKLADSPQGLVAFPHPQRVKLSDEATASRGLPKYDDLPLEEQVIHYLEQGYPDDSLWATGTMARRHSSSLSYLGDEWLREIVRWGFQDQLSFPYVCWLNGIRPTPLTDSLWNSPHIWWGAHGRG